MPAPVHDQGGEGFEALLTLVFRQSELAQVQHGKLGGVSGAIRLFAKAGAHFKYPHRLRPQAQQVLDHIVKVRRQHGTQTFVLVHPIDLLEQGMVGCDGHLAQQPPGHQHRSGHLNETVGHQRFHQCGLQPAQPGTPRSRCAGRQDGGDGPRPALFPTAGMPGCAGRHR